MLGTQPTGPAFGRPDDKLRDKAIQTAFPRRWIASLALAMTSVFLGVIGCVGLAEDVDRISRLKVTSGECGIGVKREITDRERADAIENQDSDAFHQVTPATAA